LSQIIYGQPASAWSPGQRIFFGGIALAGALTLFGALGYIIPSAQGELVALVAALVASAGSGLFAARDRSFQPESSYYKALSARYAFVADSKLRVPAFALIGFVVTFLGVERGALALWTMAEGIPGQRTVTVAGYAGATRHNLFCVGFYLRETPFTLAPAICTDKYRYSADRAPASGAKLRVYGRTTMFGIAPDEFRVLDGAS
jgi:hypothetical protein